MAITKTGQAAAEAEKNLAARKVPNPFVTQAETKVTYDPTKTKSIDFLGQNVQMKDYGPTGIAGFDQIARMNLETTKPGGELIRATNQPALEAASKAVGEQKYQTPEQSASYIKGLQSALGLKGPADVGESQRKSAFGQLDREAYMGALRSAGQLSAQGQERGSRSQALSALRGTELAGKKADVEADIQAQQAARMSDYERMLLGAAQQQGGDLSRFGAQTAQAGLQAQQAMADDEWRRKLAEYEAAMAGIQQANTADLAAMQKRQSNIAAGLGMTGTVLGAGAQLGAAGIAK